MLLGKIFKTLICFAPAAFLALLLWNTGSFCHPMSEADLQAIRVGDPVSTCAATGTNSPAAANNTCCCIKGIFTPCNPQCISNPNCPAGNTLYPNCSSADCTKTNPVDPNSNCYLPRNGFNVNTTQCVLKGTSTACRNPPNTASCDFTTAPYQYFAVLQCNAGESICANGQPTSPCVAN